jgi:hypothetical protein
MANTATGIFEPTGVIFRDYRHSAKTFLANGYEFVPRYKFLFHVYFNINVGQIPQLATVFGGKDQATVGLMVKNIQLPHFSVSVDTMNQYNRKRLVQSKIEYQPVQIVFHDDQADLIRNLWYNYYSYYYKDPSQNYNNVQSINGSMGASQTLFNGSIYNQRDIYDKSIEYTDWGYIGEAYAGSGGGTNPLAKPPFFNDIQIYGMSQKKFASYVLINPMIKDWQHDTYDYAAGDQTMQNTVIIQYETVKYYTGDIGGDTPSVSVPGFADPAYYDTVKSPIAMPGSTYTSMNNGTPVYTAQGSVNDLQAINTVNTLGAVQQSTVDFNARQTTPDIVIRQAQQMATSVFRSAVPGAVVQNPSGAGGTIFPTPPI